MERGITVTGAAEVRAAPDVLFVTLGVEAIAPRASEARASGF
ncbi:MAG: SIMPL domain-containing protein [Bifidobacterium adolescentis]